MNVARAKINTILRKVMKTWNLTRRKVKHFLQPALYSNDSLKYRSYSQILDTVVTQEALYSTILNDQERIWERPSIS